MFSSGKLPLAVVLVGASRKIDGVLLGERDEAGARCSQRLQLELHGRLLLFRADRRTLRVKLDNLREV